MFKAGQLLTPALLSRRWATHLGGGSSQNGRDSNSKRLGVKRGNGATVHRNEILVRQRGQRWKPGANVILGKDHTVHSAVDGIVRIVRDHGDKRTLIHVDPKPGPGRRDFTLTDVARHFFPQ